MRIVTAVAVIAAMGLMAGPADAQSRGRDNTVVVNKDESGRTRTRIIIQKRSYLDAGTEVLPGERKYRDYVYTPSHSATRVIDNTPFSRPSFMGPFDLPGKNNPFQ